MQYPIIIPEYYEELVSKDQKDHPDIVYNVLTTPAAVEYVFPLSNENVVKKLMEIKEPIKYKMIKLKPEEEAEYIRRAEDLIDEFPVLRSYWDVKGVTMNVLQDRRYTLEKRMVILNFVYKNVQIMLDKSKDEFIPQFIGEFIRQPNHDDVMKYFESIKPNVAYSMIDGLSFLASLPVTEKYSKIRADICKTIGISPDMKEVTLKEDISMAVKKEFYTDFLKDREHYYENVIINYAWTFCMPYADYSIPVWKNFIFFNTLFNAVKTLLTCYTYGKKDKDKAFIEAVTAFDEALRQYQGNVVARIAAANEKEGLSNNGDMAILSMS